MRLPERCIAHRYHRLFRSKQICFDFENTGFVYKTCVNHFCQRHLCSVLNFSDSALRSKPNDSMHNILQVILLRRVGKRAADSLSVPFILHAGSFYTLFFIQRNKEYESIQYCAHRIRSAFCVKYLLYTFMQRKV